MELANTIRRQLGGNLFSIMTGAKNFTYNSNSLTFKIGRNSSKANHVRVTLEGNDTYTMEFIKATVSELKEIARHDMIYADQLQEVFTDVTGMHTTL